MANNFFPKLNFTQFVNQNVKILGRRLYSLSLKELAWLEHAWLIFLIFHSFVCIFFPHEPPLDVHLPSQFVNQNIEILGRRLYSPSLKDVAWLEDAQLIFLIFHTFVCFFSCETCLDILLPSQILQTNVSILEKVICHWIPIQTL